MKNRINKYFFHEFIRYFAVVLFASVSIIWTIQAVNFLDLVTEDGHAFRIYIEYSLLTITKVATKLIPLSFLFATILTILKFEKENELIILWTTGLNKIRVVNLIFRISLLVMFFQLVMSTTITPETLNHSRSLIKSSELQFVPSLLKERQFNDTVQGLTIFVGKKNDDGTYKNIFIRDEGKLVTQIAVGGSSTILSKSGYVLQDEKILVLLNGIIQKMDKDGSINIIRFEETTINLSGLTTKTISEAKVQETSTAKLIACIAGRNLFTHNCGENEKTLKESKIELNKRFGMPFFLPLIALICCFLLSSRHEKKMSGIYKYIYGLIGFAILVGSEVIVRYSGISGMHTLIYYLLPICLMPLIYLFLIRTFKYENIK